MAGEGSKPTDLLPAWRSHKVVHAAPIAEFKPSKDGGSSPVCFVIVGTDQHAVGVPENFAARGAPQPGDFLVVYEDGYKSWSPRVAFLDGYTLV